MESILSLKNVKKSIKKKEIIKGLSFDVKKGQIYGFLGPNGAGKTMTLRMIVGLIKPSSGSVSICGYDVQKKFVKAMENVGCIIENPEMYDYLTGYENLCHFNVMDKQISCDEIKRIVDLVGMSHKINDPVQTYSLGMKQRLGIAQALMKKPKLLLLDEPTNGLDPAGIKEFRQLMKKLSKEEGMTIFVSSHLLSEVQMICDEVAIILHGKLIQTSTVEDLLKNQKVVWHLDQPEKALNILKEHYEIDAFLNENNHLTTSIKEHHLSDINHTFFQNNIQIIEVFYEKKSLEDLFMTLTGGQTIG